MSDRLNPECKKQQKKHAKDQIFPITPTSFILQTYREIQKIYMGKERFTDSKSENERPNDISLLNY